MGDHLVLWCDYLCAILDYENKYEPLTLLIDELQCKDEVIATADRAKNYYN
jgi:hypothetical protein